MTNKQGTFCQKTRDLLAVLLNDLDSSQQKELQELVASTFVDGIRCGLKDPEKEP